jgi:SOS-response transcriptional repressor LexA
MMPDIAQPFLAGRAGTVLRALDRYIAAERKAPTFRALAEVAGLRSTSSVAYWLQRLRDRGLVDYDDGLNRTLTVTLAGASAIGRREPARLTIDVNAERARMGMEPLAVPVTVSFCGLPEVSPEVAAAFAELGAAVVERLDWGGQTVEESVRQEEAYDEAEGTVEVVKRMDYRRLGAGRAS